MELIPLLVLAVLYFVPVLFLRRKSKLSERFKWPLLYFVAAFALSLILQPFPYKAINEWRALHHQLRVELYVLVSIIYLLGAWRSGRKLYWLVCLAVTLAVQPFALWLTSPIYRLLYR